jgi:hypothetical protein
MYIVFKKVPNCPPMEYFEELHCIPVLELDLTHEKPPAYRECKIPLDLPRELSNALFFAVLYFDQGI